MTRIIPELADQITRDPDLFADHLMNAARGAVSGQRAPSLSRVALFFDSAGLAVLFGSRDGDVVITDRDKTQRDVIEALFVSAVDEADGPTYPPTNDSVTDAARDLYRVICRHRGHPVFDQPAADLIRRITRNRLHTGAMVSTGTLV